MIKIPVEFLTSFASLSLDNPLILSTGVAVVRAVAGWLENALENGHIDRFELKQLAGTIFRVLPQALGLSALLGPVAAPGALITDFAITKYAHKK